MTVLSAAKTILEADSTLLATATGGVWDFTELGRMGLNRSNSQAAAAFTNGIVQPCIVLKIRSSTLVDGMSDDVAQKAAQRQMLECWFYADNSYAAIETMMARVYVDLHGKRVDNHACRWQFDGPQFHDLDLDAFGQRSDFAIWSIKS